MIPTPSQMQDMLAELLEGAAGNSREHWRRAIGEVEQLPTHFHVRCNWRVHPRGRKRDLDAIQKAVEIVRQEHPYIA
jgi:hypothetical protein